MFFSKKTATTSLLIIIGSAVMLITNPTQFLNASSKNVSEPAGQEEQSSTANAESGVNSLINSIHKGEATFFKTDGRGACLLGKSPDDLMLAAIDKENFDDSNLCGAYLRIEGPKGEAIVKVVDLCPGCKAGHVDLSPEAFSKIADLSAGHVDITWQIISPELEDPIAYFLKSGNAKNIGLVEIRNHRNQIAKIEFKDKDGQWTNIPRAGNNYFEYYAGMGSGPFSFRTTDIYGNELTDTDIAYTKGKPVSGKKQFPAPPKSRPE